MAFRQIIHVIGAVVFAISSSGAYAAPAFNPQKLSLAQSYQIAEQRNYDLRLSAVAVDNANAAAGIASQAPNPTLTVQTFGINPRTGIGAGSLRNKTVDTTIRADQLIERGDKRALRMESAEHFQHAARKDLEETRRQMRIGVAQAYYDVMAAEKKFTIAQDNAALYDISVAAAQKRQKAGDIAGADVARLQVDAGRARNDAAQAESDIARTRQALALLLGLTSQAAQIRLADDWPEIRFDTLAMPEFLIDRRADVAAAQSRLAATLSARKLALASRTRDVLVGLQYEHYPASAANLQGSGNSFGVSVQIPLFVRHQFEGEIRAAEAAVDAARANLDKTRELARAELMGSWEGARLAYGRIKRYDDSLLAAAKKSADAAEFAFSHGALGVMDVLDARRTYRAIQIDALTARADFAKSLVAWQAAIPEEPAQ